MGDQKQSQGGNQPRQGQTDRDNQSGTGTQGDESTRQAQPRRNDPNTQTTETGSDQQSGDRQSGGSQESNR